MATLHKMKMWMLLLFVFLSGCYTQADYKRWEILDAQAKAADAEADHACQYDPPSDTPYNRCVYLLIQSDHLDSLAWYASPIRNQWGGGSPAWNFAFMSSVMSH